MYIDCRSSSGTAELAGTYTRTVFLLHDCPASVKKKSDVILSDSIIYTTSTSPKNSIQFSGSGMRIGADPNCTGTGRGALLTRGGFDTAAGTTFKNGIVRALGSISFAAQFGSSDTSGMSVIAGGEVDTTSNSVFNACPSDPDAPPVLPTFALVQ